ncbi:MAG: murein L,D-transpeptidase catalytic domain family protein [Bdellovibrionaceae bacterium]|nr:murein L,D-transpeptidase catalytic domain family protein [Pseudobdellovibrionaceae bacterium]
MRTTQFQWMTTALVTMTLLLSACAETRLADDPMNEPSAQEAPLENQLPPEIVEEPLPSPSGEEAILAKYAHLDPSRLVPTNLLKKAVLYYDANSTKFSNKGVLSVIDFSARSTKARFFVINMTSGSVWSVHVAHGKNSDPDHDGYATSFSNVSGSNQSSLGVYRTAEQYNGSNGLSMRLDGLSATNSNARARAIVIHGASYVKDSAVVQGRSWGCPAISMASRDKLYAMIKGGSMIYAGLSAKE